MAKASGNTRMANSSTAAATRTAASASFSEIKNKDFPKINETVHFKIGSEAFSMKTTKLGDNMQTIVTNDTNNKNVFNVTYNEAQKDAALNDFRFWLSIY